MRFTGGWETADYVVFEWRDLSGEFFKPYPTANDDSVSIDFPLTAGEISLVCSVSAAAERSYLVRAGAGRSARDGVRPAVYGHRQPPQLLHFCIEQSAAGALRLCLCRRRAIADRDRGLPARCPVRRPRVCRRQFDARTVDGHGCGAVNSRLGKTTKANCGPHRGAIGLCRIEPDWRRLTASQRGPKITNSPLLPLSNPGPGFMPLLSGTGIG